MNIALNGWFGRFIKGAIKKVAGLVDSTLNNATMGVSSEIGSFEAWADELGSGGSSFWNRMSNNTSNIDNLDDLANDPRGNYEPTKTEAVILENFSNELAKTIIDTTKEQVNAFNVYNSNATNIYKYSLLNALLQRIAVIKEFYKVNDTTGLSVQAIDLRNLMIEVLFYKIIQEVENVGFQNQSFDLQSVVIKIPQNDFIKEIFPSYKTTQVSLSVNYYQFKEQGKNIDPINEIPGDLINPVDQIIPGDSNGNSTIDTITTEIKKTKPLTGFIAGSLFLGFLFFASRKKENQKK
jgi:hypothetical protein